MVKLYAYGLNDKLKCEVKKNSEEVQMTCMCMSLNGIFDETFK